MGNRGKMAGQLFRPHTMIMVICILLILLILAVRALGH